MNAARRLRFATPVAVVCALAGGLAFAGAPAQAKTVHIPAGSFGSAGTGPGQLEKPQGVAVNDSTEPLMNPAAEDVYVVDTGNDRVERFSATGKYLGQFDGSGTYENLEEPVGETVKTGPAAPTGAFSEPTLVAVDNSGSLLDSSAGDVYVVDSGHGVIDKFTETGAYVGQLTGGRCENEQEAPPCKNSKLLPFFKGESGISGIAVDPAGTLLADEHPGKVYSFNDGAVNEYVSACETEFGPGLANLGVDSEGNLYLSRSLEHKVKVNDLCETLTDPFGNVESTFGIAVDTTHGEVYIDYGTAIGAYSLGGSEIERFGSGGLPVTMFGEASRGVAVDASNGTVYVTDLATDDVVVFDAVTLPTVSAGALSEQEPRSVTLNGTVNPEGSPVTSCVFEYVAASEYDPSAAEPYEKGAKVACEPGQPGGSGGGTAAVAVKAHLPGLVAETKYHYRLVTENKAGVPSATPDQQFSTGPVLGGEFVTNVASSSATLGESIDPNGDDAHYYLQYGTSVSYGSYAPVSPPGVDLGAGAETQAVSLHLQDLAAGTTYHYRFVVLQGGEEFADPDRVLTTQGVTSGPVLADARAWELVSPADNRGGLIEPFAGGVGDAIQAAGDGSGITYLTAGSAVGEDPQGRINWSQVLSVRAGGGWRSTDLSLPRRIPGNEELAAEQGSKPEYEMFSPDLSLAAIEPSPFGTPPLSAQASERTIYLRDDVDGSFVPLVTAGNVPEGAEFGGEPFESTALKSSARMYFVTATPDLSHVLLATPFALTPEAVYEGEDYLTHNQWNLYEWSAGRLALVNVLPESEGGEPTRGFAISVRLAGGSVTEGSPQGVNPSAISSDGRRIAWDLGVPGIGDYNGLFVRDMVDESTVRVSGPGGVFQWMSSDGSKVFFVEGGDLRECEIVEAAGKISCAFTDLTANHGAGESSGGVQELVSDVSRDGSYVYFVAKGVLGQGGIAPVNAQGQAPVSGERNLYLLHDAGSVWKTTFIATLSPEGQGWDSRLNEDDLVSDLSHITSRVSPNGRYLAFMSDRPLTGYDSTDAVSGQPDEEVYLYDAQGDGGVGTLVCASCDPTGARPVGVRDPQASSGSSLLVDRAHVWGGHWLAGSIPGWDGYFTGGSQYQPRYLSDSGRLFFNSPDGLVPHATNGVEDVYEYEPVGVGGCSEGVVTGATVFAASSGGCVGLMSAGTSGQESVFFDASESGDDVFFVTEAKLTGAETGKSYALYDAHVCGSEGVGCVSEAVSSPPCSSGDSCKAAPSPQPEIFGPAPSATFSGAGNPAPEPAKPAAKPKAKSLTRAQKLAKALKVCNRNRSKRNRAVCEQQARRVYGVVKKGK